MVLDFFDYAWNTSFQITKKKHGEVKLLVRDDVVFPLLGKDDAGYVICLPEPKKISGTTVEFHGLQLHIVDEFQKRVLWQLFRASVFHTSLHIATLGFESYSHWAKGKNEKLALYVASIIEDSVANAYLKNMWSPFIPDVALANAIAYLRLKPIRLIFDDSLRLMATILSYFTIGKGNGKLSEEMQNTADNVVSYLSQIENDASEFLLKNETQEKFTEKKLKVADEIYVKLRKYGNPPSVVSLPYTDTYGDNSVYRRNVTATEEEFNELLNMAFSRFESQIFIDDSCERETNQAFSEWEARRERQNKIIENYKELLTETRFGGIEFPKEDYTEYLRSKQLLSSPVRRVMEKLRLLKNITGEDFKQESGLVDLQEAIQVVASNSQRTDIFVREELQTREEAWAIVIDASQSLSHFTGEVRGIALSLGETAKNLIPTRSAWGIFAFNEKFHIIKDFSENYSSRVCARIGGLQYGGLTYLPDSLKIAKQLLRKRIEEAKIIVLVSDFFPSGDKVIEEEAIQTIKQIEHSGFGLIGIGVKSRAVKNYVRVNCVVKTPYDLMKNFTKAFLEYSSSV